MSAGIDDPERIRIARDTAGIASAVRPGRV
jgi:hypothetical protein